MGIPWQEAEALYWTLGQDDIARRAKKSCPSEHNTSEDLLSIRSTDGDWHENRASKISSPLHNSVQPTFENYRTYHFNTTMAPKVQYRKFVNETTAGKLPHAATVGSKWVNGEVSSIHPAAVANLTTEGKRQVLPQSFPYKLISARASLTGKRRPRLRETSYAPGLLHRGIERHQ